MTVFSRLALGAGTLAATAMVLSACGGGGSSEGQGTLRMALTDAPACGFDEVNVTVERVRVHKSGTAPETDGGWEEIALSAPKRVNLLELTNGMLEELGSTALPAGKYTQLRLVLAQNKPGSPPANSVKPTGGTEMALDTPSALQSGLKLPVNIEVVAGQQADFVLDFDACKSVVTNGKSKTSGPNGYSLKPVVSLLPRTTTPGLMVQGQLAGTLGGAATVSLQQGGIVVRSTVAMTDDPATPADEGGRFVLSPVPAGTYDLVISAEGHVTAVMTGVPVSQTAVTTVTPAGIAIDLPVSPTRTASGTVSITGSTVIPDATVRVLQTIDGTKVELASRPVDAVTGAYGFVLPTAAPLKAAYDARATAAPSFASVGSVAGKYMGEAEVPGKATLSATIDVSTADAVTPFAFAP